MRRPPLDDRGIWASIKEFTDIRIEKRADGIAKISINRPEVRNAILPLTVEELLEAFGLANEDPAVGVVIPCGEGDMAFCSGGDLNVRGHAG